MTQLATAPQDAEVQSLLDSPLTKQEATELEACELQIELAGKTRFEQALIIGEKLSTIYNKALFRGDGGRTWADWVEQRLHVLLGAESVSLQWADDRRFIHEVRACLPPSTGAGPLPAATTVARALAALIPRRFTTAQNVGWNPAELNQPAEGMVKVWKLSQRNAVQQQRKNGPTKQDVADAREELRPMLLEQGLIREAPKAFQQSTADRMAAAAARREAAQRTYDIQPERTEAFDKLMDDIKKTRPERQKAAEVAAVKEELARPERERLQRVEDQIRKYHSKLSNASNAVHDLLVYLRGIDRTDGTEYLMDLRDGDVMGLITVADDLKRIKTMGEELMEAAKLANSCTPASGIDMTTLEVDVV